MAICCRKDSGLDAQEVDDAASTRGPDGLPTSDCVKCGMTPS